MEKNKEVVKGVLEEVGIKLNGGNRSKVEFVGEEKIKGYLNELKELKGEEMRLVDIVDFLWEKGVGVKEISLVVNREYREIFGLVNRFKYRENRKRKLMEGKK